MNIFKKIALWNDISQVRDAVKEADVNKIKSGVKSTEFWLALIAAIVPVLNQQLGLNLPIEAIIGIAGIAIAYIFGRSMVKKGGVPPAPPAAMMAILILSALMFAGSALAEDVQTAPSAPAITQATEEGFKVTSPFETGAVGFWFPGDGTFAMGLSQTFLRVEHTSIPKLSLDLDATIAQEINEGKDTLAGIGAKLNYNVQKVTSTGFVFAPSLGITALNNFAKNKAIKDIAQNFKIAIYGTILLYKW